MMDSNFLKRSPKALLKDLGKVLLDSSRALSKLSTNSDSEDEDNDQGIILCCFVANFIT